MTQMRFRDRTCGNVSGVLRNRKNVTRSAIGPSTLRLGHRPYPSTPSTSSGHAGSGLSPLRISSKERKAGKRKLPASGQSDRNGLSFGACMSGGGRSLDFQETVTPVTIPVCLI